MDWKQRLGAEIRKARKQKGMTQEELREALLHNGFSVSLPTLRFYENGKRAPNFDDLRNFAAVLKTDHFEIDDQIRIEFSRNGKSRPEPDVDQLNLRFDEGHGVDIRIECGKEGLTIKKATA